jgi:hypothetical protein
MSCVVPIPSAVEIVLSDEERAVLESGTARRKTAQAVALLARIVLAAAGQLTNAEIAELEGASRSTVTKRRNRFAARRLEGLLDEPRPGRPRTITDEQVERVIITRSAGSIANCGSLRSSYGGSIQVRRPSDW